MLMAVNGVATRGPEYIGLRLSADDFFALDDDGCHYELIDGVVCMSPSPTRRHQEILTDLTVLIGHYLADHPVGRLIVEVDVHFGAGLSGGDLVYRPDITFLRAERVSSAGDPMRVVPDLVVEIVSPSSRRFDNETKRFDYERLGVCEYWIIDHEQESMQFLRLVGGKYEDIVLKDGAVSSEVIEGFSLEIARIQKVLGAPKKS